MGHFCHSRLGLMGTFALILGLIGACGAEDSLHPVSQRESVRPTQETIEPSRPLVGKKGKLRFNLQFSNHEAVDLDLYVAEPGGTTISYSEPHSSSGGELDVDCRCGSCEQGPNENITWPGEEPPEGSYKVWVEYFGACSGGVSATSDYVLRILENDTEVQMFKGSLQSGRTEVFVHRKN